METKYSDMYSLFRHDSQAQQYFRGLPDYVQEQISTRYRHVNSMESLKNYAENLTRGDG